MARLYAPIQERSNRRLYETIVEKCREFITPETRVLELACGSGQLTFPLCEGAGSWEATDFSEKMLREARRRQPDSPARFSVQDATDLPYEDASFDLVIIANALHIMPRPEKALAEIRRVLRPGGVMLAPTFVYEGKFNRFRMRLTEMAGFRTYNKWNGQELLDFTKARGFRITREDRIPGDPLPVCFLAAEPLPPES